MNSLNAAEARVLGVLVEKAFTVPSQYPITLNALTAGCSQKNNRNPVRDYDENTVLDALSDLRDRQLAMTVDLSGSRVLKYRHAASQTLNLSAAELVILAELLLRGPQTLGELRGNAGRMHPLESLEAAAAALDSLMNRPEPLVRRLPRAAGERAERFVQLLSPDLHPLDQSSATASAALVASSPALADRVTRLEAEMAELRRRLDQLAGRSEQSV